MGKSEEILPHTRIFRSNRKLCLTALALSATLPEPHKIFLKTSQSLQPEAIVQLLRDAHILYHNDSRSMSRSSLLRDFASWKDLVQRVEAEGGGESKLSLAVALGGLLASSDFLDQVALLETRFGRSEAEATVILTTVHQAKGLEWDRVFVEDDFRPVYGADRSQRLEVSSLWHQDELNHLYVAITRAKRQLIISMPVLQWIAAIRGLYSYMLTTKSGPCHLCQSAKAPIVVKKYRIACFDFLNPHASHRLRSLPLLPEAAYADAQIDMDPVQEAQGCLSCLTSRVDTITDPELNLFVASAAKIAKQRPAAPKTAESASTSTLAPLSANFELDTAKHPFLFSEHRAMKWAIMHHEFKTAVFSWFS
jgi:F-box protein 18 (helicase)